MRVVFKKVNSFIILSAFLLCSSIIKAQSISTDSISGSPFCACTNIDVSFTSNWYFNPGNIFTVQLSNATGNFATPVIIGALVSEESADTITCTLPCNAITGSGYRIRVISSDTSLVGSDNGVNLTINASVVSSVDISADSLICPGDPVLFTANPTNGGTSPKYQWKVNGLNVGTDTSVYLASALNNGDKVWVVMVADTLCPMPDSISSDTITMIVTSPIPASVFIFTHDTIVCAGDPVGFIAIPIAGGTAPSFQWVLNGGNVGSNSYIYVADSLQQGDEVYVIMTSSASCASGSPATSNKLTIDVVTSITPTVSISASATTICSGDLVSFNASATGGGINPSYQWKINGINVGTDSSSFYSYTLADDDMVSVVMTSGMSCASPALATSNSVTMDVTTSVTALVSISVNITGPVCIGQSITFTATPTNGGTSPLYQWQLNGNNVGTNATTFTTSTLNSGDVVTVTMTSNAICARNSPVTSNPITMTVSATVTPSVSILPTSPVTICPGSTAGFLATPTSGGTTPIYQWQVNGVNSGTPTTSRIFVSSTLNNGDVVKVIMTSDMPCANPTTAADSVTIITSSALPVTVNSSTICSGQTTTLTASGGTTYLWSTGVTTTSISVSPSVTTSYTVTGITSGCSGSALATVTVNNSPTITVTSATICAGGSATLTAGGGNTYSWNTGATTTSITVTPGATSYTVTGTSGGCTGTAVATVTISTSLTVTVNSPSICAGETATLTANNGTSYVWSPGGETTNPITVTPAITTTYTVVGTSGTCIDSAISVVTIVTTLPVTVTSAAVCPGQTATLTASGAVTYSWTTGETTSSITVPSIPASYTVTGYSSSGGCSGTAIASVTIASATPVTISGNLVINACEETTLTAMPAGNSYSWGPNISCSNCQSVTVTPPATQQYYVNYTDSDGCSDGDTVTVVVTTLNTYFLPTALSPNGDGINDEIHFHGRGINSFTLRIFDRIGEKVFETSDIERGWDGKLLGVPMNNAVFVYTLNITFCNGEEVRTKGAITLVK